jgi:hypothetical protein
MKQLVPTIGRRMYFFCSDGVLGAEDLTALDSHSPFDAGVIYVHDAQTVNVLVTDHEGNMVAVTHVHVRQESDAMVGSPDFGLWVDGELILYWVEWMPYQVQAAAKEAENNPTSV